MNNINKYMAIFIFALNAAGVGNPHLMQTGYKIKKGEKVIFQLKYRVVRGGYTYAVIIFEGDDLNNLCFKSKKTYINNSFVGYMVRDFANNFFKKGFVCDVKAGVDVARKIFENLKNKDEANKRLNELLELHKEHL